MIFRLGREVPEEHHDEEEPVKSESRATFASEYYNLNHGLNRTLNQIRAMFYKNFCYIKQNYLLILSLYIFTILFVLMAYLRNDDAAYLVKGSNFKQVINYCKDSILKQHGTTEQERDL